MAASFNQAAQIQDTLNQLCLIKKEFSNFQWLWSPIKDCSGFILVKQSELFDDSLFTYTLLYCPLCHYPLQGPPAWKLDNIQLLEVMKQGWTGCINSKSHLPRCLPPMIRTMSISCKEKQICNKEKLKLMKKLRTMCKSISKLMG